MSDDKKTAAGNNQFPQMEEEVLAFWERAQTFAKSVAKDAPQGDYVFYDGPPFATGEPHYGHIVASVMKDAVPRFWTMRGYRVERKWGWDCHGLPLENLAEKELELKDKTEIEKLGVEKFNDYCESIVLRYADYWKSIIRRVGRWADMENDYKTMDPEYMESIWWVFKTLFDKGLIYQGHKAMHICPRCGTTLSNFEVAQGYKDIKDLSAIAKFELKNTNGNELFTNLTNGEKVYVLAWTTTPWTLIGNVALAVGGDVDYILVKIDENKLESKAAGGGKNILDENISVKLIKAIVSKDFIKRIEEDHSRYFKVIKEIKGSDLVGLQYKPLFNYYSENEKVENKENGWKIYAGDFVSTEEGTGVVHIAPAFGEDDLKLAREYNLPFVQHVDLDGRIKAEAVDFAGLEVKPKGDHMATDVEIIKYLAHHDSLFAKEKYEHSYPHCWRCDTPLLNYATASWFVEVTKFKDKLIEANDQINWVPDHIKSGRFGKWLEGVRDWSISRNRYWGAPLPVWTCDKCQAKTVVGSREELEKLSGTKADNLHKQYVDKLEWPCACGGHYRRIPEVLDCWFESGSMPYGQEHYPFANKEKFEHNFPAQFIAEGVDQTRGWFYTMLVVSVALFDKASFENVIVNGIVLAEDGQKMSKRLKNYPDPSYIFDQYSVDAMRYYLLASPVLLAEDLNFSEAGVKDVLRNVSMTLWNVYKFYSLFAEKTPDLSSPAPDSKNILDQWIIARFNQLTREITENMEKYILPKAVRPIEDFISDLSTWYLRRSRDRFKGENQTDKQSALKTTAYILLNLAKVMAPFMPFIAEQIWQKISGRDFQNEEKSVHLEKWPDQSSITNGELRIIEEMAVIRKVVELGLAKRDEAGVKVRQPLQKLKIKNLKLKIEDTYLNLILDEINVKEIDQETGEGELAVELDLTITEELKREGVKRDLVRLVNNLRKDNNLNIADQAVLTYQTDSELIRQVLTAFAEEIKKETLCAEIKAGEIKGADAKINGETVRLQIDRI